MRCYCCNRNLSDYESTIRHAETFEFLDTCCSCLNGLNIPYIGNPDLDNSYHYEEYEDEYGDTLIYIVNEDES